jgi:hypothetical protein
MPEPFTQNISSQDPAETAREFARASKPLNCVVVSSSLEMLELASGFGASFILSRGPSATKTGIANVVNQHAWDLRFWVDLCLVGL